MSEQNIHNMQSVHDRFATAELNAPGVNYSHSSGNDNIGIVQVKMEPINGTDWWENTPITTYNDTLFGTGLSNGEERLPKHYRLNYNDDIEIKEMKIEPKEEPQDLYPSWQSVGAGSKPEENHTNAQIQSYYCQRCQNSFSHQAQLQLHVLDRQCIQDPADNKKKKSFACGQCKRTFGSRMLLKDHQRNHNRSECPLCGTTISQKSLRRHINRHYLDARYFRCVWCKTSFATKRDLDVHINTSHPPDSYCYSQMVRKM